MTEKKLEKHNLLYTRTSTEGMHKYQFVDFFNKRLVEYPGETPANLTACYDGLAWWLLDGNQVPTFMDLDTPEKVYYSEKKTITGFKTTGDFTQCDKSRESHHFAFDNELAASDMVDFATGTVTQVTCPLVQNSDGYRLVFGFVNGRFQPRCVSKVTRKLMTEEIGFGHEW